MLNKVVFGGGKTQPLILVSVGQALDSVLQAQHEALWQGRVFAPDVERPERPVESQRRRWQQHPEGQCLLLYRGSAHDRS